jgi:putative glycerol-1-phosphate prenyltransferase
MESLLEQINRKCRDKKKLFGVLIDPDSYQDDELIAIARLAGNSLVDFFLVGGSILIKDKIEKTISLLREHSGLAVILFPGSTIQVSEAADALLLLSVISGRNAEMLIGNHVIAAPMLKKSRLEIIPTGYMLIESGKLTSVQYMSNTTPIPSGKSDIAVSTAIAGEMLGMKLIYLEAGSGADHSVSPEMISSVKQNISVPLIVGGGIRDVQQARKILHAGADMIIVGNAIEKNRIFITEISDLFKNEFNQASINSKNYTS